MPNSDLRKVLAKCKTDPLFFMSLLKVVDKGTKKLVQFVPKPEQVRLLEVLTTSNRVIVLKGRQIGVSTLVAAYYLWKLYFTTDPVVHGLVAQNQRNAKKLLAEMKRMMGTLPDALQREMDPSNTLEYKFKDTGAGAECFTAGGDSGDGARGFSFSSAHLTEYAYWTEQVDSLGSILDTVGNGQVVIETTPNGPGNNYHSLCLLANQPDSEWTLFFSPWYKDKHSDYDRPVPRVYQLNTEEAALQAALGLTRSQLFWRANKIATTSRESFDRENPTTEEDAFRSSELLFMPPHLFTLVGKLGYRNEYIYQDPTEHDRYCMGVDVSGGTGNDYSSIVVLSRATGLPVYQFRSNTLLPEKFAEKVASIQRRYHDAYTLVESNNHGHLVLYVLKQLGVRALYQDGGKTWTTSKQSKWFAFDTLRAQLLSTLPDNLESNLYDELTALVVPDNKTPQAPVGLHDDLAVAYALAHVALLKKGRHIRTDVGIEMVRQQRMRRRARQLRQTFMGHTRRT